MTKTSKTPKAAKRSKKTAEYRVNRDAVHGKFASEFAQGQRWKRRQMLIQGL